MKWPKRGSFGKELGGGSPTETIPERNGALMTPLAMSIKLYWHRKGIGHPR